MSDKIADLSHVLDADRLVQSSGKEPHRGEPWRFVSVSYKAADGRAGRDAALASLRALLGETLMRFAARAKVPPRLVECVVLRGEWMRETLVKATAPDARLPAGIPPVAEDLVFIDSAFAFTADGVWLGQRDTDFPPRTPGAAFMGLADSGPAPVEPPDADEPVTVTTSHG